MFSRKKIFLLLIAIIFFGSFAKAQEVFGCGNNVCEIDDGETRANCPQDCAICPDGVRDPNGKNGIPGDSDDEECDDGDAISYNQCSNTCKTNTTLFCGDGTIDSDGLDNDPATTADNEECDEGANNSGFGTCSAACKTTICGDGTVQPLNGQYIPEQCDGGAGCDSLCQLSANPIVCGDRSFKPPTENCETAWDWAQGGCLSNECSQQACTCPGISKGVKILSSQMLDSGSTPTDVIKSGTLPKTFVVKAFVLNSHRSPLTFDADINFFRGFDQNSIAKISSTQSFGAGNPPGPFFSIDLMGFPGFDQTFKALSPGSYRAVVTIKNAGVPVAQKEVFFTLTSADIIVPVSETDQFLTVLVAMTVIGIIGAQKKKTAVKK